LAEIKDSFNKD